MLLAVSKATGRDCACLPHIAIGLQGGLMAGEVCGALSGGALAIGLIYGQEMDEAVPLLTEELMAAFAKRIGGVRCADIIGFNIGSIESRADPKSLKGMLTFGLRGGKRVCEGVVSSALEVLLEQLEDFEA